MRAFHGDLPPENAIGIEPKKLKLEMEKSIE
jgi:hypothetical protein